MKKVFVINGSASGISANQKIIGHCCRLAKSIFVPDIFRNLKSLPHFDPECSSGSVPETILAFRRRIETSDGVLFCTPEYIFSVPSGLKNAIEWCVATTIFTDKPIGIITASANGVRGHEELQMLMHTLMARFNPDTTLLIQGARGKVNEQGYITDPETREGLQTFIDAFKKLIEESPDISG